MLLATGSRCETDCINSVHQQDLENRRGKHQLLKFLVVVADIVIATASQCPEISFIDAQRQLQRQLPDPRDHSLSGIFLDSTLPEGAPESPATDCDTLLAEELSGDVLGVIGKDLAYSTLISLPNNSISIYCIKCS